MYLTQSSNRGLKNKNASHHQPRETFCEKTGEESPWGNSLQIQGGFLSFKKE